MLPILASFAIYSLVVVMVLSAVSMVSSFEADDLVRYTRFGWGGREKQIQNKQQLYASLRHVDAVRSRTKAERGKPSHTAALSKQK